MRAVLPGLQHRIPARDGKRAGDMPTASRILGVEVGSTAPVFLAFLAVHVIAGLAAVGTGAVAALARKGSTRHVRAGRWFCVLRRQRAPQTLWDRLPTLSFWLLPS